ncbi:tetratricopeptide repeat protein [Marinicella sp. W31]|uniref:tetratricopeptide repeat protein n=1 Tax=Marinicella sp. W31 TaxID=3023713 RepID=UPI0037582CED
MTKLVLFSVWGLLSCLFFFLLQTNRKARQQEHWIRKQLPEATVEDKQQLQQKLDQLLTQKSSASPRLKYTLLFALSVIPTALILNTFVGNHDAPENTVAVTQDSQPPDLETAVLNLKKKLEENPNDLEGQLLYARSMIRLQRFPEAVAAMEKAYQLAPDNAVVIADLAEALAYQSGTGNFLGRPEELLTQALQFDPNNQKAMWLQGINYFEKGLFTEANALWSRLLPMVESDNIRNMLSQQINQARSQIGLPLLSDEGDASIVVKPVVKLSITISDTYEAQLAERPATLFVFARQTDGPPMPIAARRLEPPFNFPLKLALSDVHSLNQNIKLSAVDFINVSAKLSFSGSATPAADDIISDSVPAETGSEQVINLHIDRIRS